MRASLPVSSSSPAATLAPMPPSFSAWSTALPSIDTWPPSGTAPSATTTIENLAPRSSRWAIVARHRFESERDLGDEDGVGAGGDARLEGDPPGVASHHLDDDHPAVRRRRREQSVDALRGEADRRVEAERLDRLVEVVVDRLGHADDAQPGLVESLGDLQRAVAADRDESVDVADGEQLDELVGAIDLDVASRRAGAPGTPSGCPDWWCRGSCRRGGRCRAPPPGAAARSPPSR